MTVLLFVLLYGMVACVAMLAGMLAMPYDKDDLADSVVWPLAMFWPLTLIGLVFFLLFRASGVFEADHCRQEELRVKRAARA